MIINGFWLGSFEFNVVVQSLLHTFTAFLGPFINVSIIQCSY